MEDSTWDGIIAVTGPLGASGVLGCLEAENDSLRLLGIQECACPFRMQFWHGNDPLHLLLDVLQNRHASYARRRLAGCTLGRAMADFNI